ncbi:MAG: hypothetical protein JO182_25065, partial [Acidobacteriaceae bacterium]|nr:hypothetical protein [Acidobacteriaceae bacterium]
MQPLSYTTPHGIVVTRTSSKIPFARGLDKLLKELDTERGVYLSSGYEYPGRYSRWDVACVAPCLEIVGHERTVSIRALNVRGQVLIGLLKPLVWDHPHWTASLFKRHALLLQLKPLADKFPEEERSKQPSPFSLLRALVGEFRHPDDSRLALIGAFGYDLLLQFDPIKLRL